MSDNQPILPPSGQPHGATEDTAGGQRFRTLLKDVASSSVIFFCAAYLIGWTHDVSYFGEFGLDASTLSLSAVEVAANAVRLGSFAIWPVFMGLWAVAALLLVAASSSVSQARLSGWWSKLRSPKNRKPKPAWLASLDNRIGAFFFDHTGAIAFCFIFFVFWVFATIEGTRSAKETIGNRKVSVRIAFKDLQNQKTNAALIESSDSGNLDYVVQTKDLVVLFDRYPGSVIVRNTYILSRSDLAFFQMSAFHGKK